MNSFSPRLNLSLRATPTKTLAGVGTVGFRLAVAKQISPTCNVLYSATRSLAAGASEVLDLAGSLADAFGDTVTFARVRGIIVEQTGASAIRVGPLGEAAPFSTMFVDASDGIRVRNGGLFVLLAADADATAYPVTAGTGDDLKVVNEDGSNAASYTITLFGSSS